MKSVEEWGGLQAESYEIRKIHLERFSCNRDGIASHSRSFVTSSRCSLGQLQEMIIEREPQLRLLPRTHPGASDLGYLWQKSASLVSKEEDWVSW